MAELSKPGSATEAYTSSAAARPKASIKGWSKAGSGSIVARMRSRCSSTETSSSVMLQDATCRHALGRSRLQGDIADDLDLAAERPVTGDRPGRGLAQARRPVREAALELGDQPVVVRVEVDVRRLAGGVEHEVPAD